MKAWASLGSASHKETGQLVGRTDPQRSVRPASSAFVTAQLCE